MPNANWTFFQGFLKAPRTVASVIPSSSFLEKRVIRTADAAHAKVVVEFGAGTGGITRALLKAMPNDSHLIAIERTGEFVHSLSAIDDPRFEVVHGCASSILEQLENRRLRAADAVISGIPFSTMPPELCITIMGALYQALAPNARFVAYQFSDRVADYARPVMGEPVVQHELRNVPPMRVFSWRKAAVMAHNGARAGVASQ